MGLHSEPSSSVCFGSSSPTSNGSIGDNLSEVVQIVDHSTMIKLISSLEQLLLNSAYDYRDATFIFGDNKVGVHRCILAARSSFFHELFQREKLPEYDLQKVLRFGNVGYDAFHTILTYLYSGKLKPLPAEVATCMDSTCCHEACRPVIDFTVELMYASHVFDLPELASSFERNLLNLLGKATDEDVFPVLMVAYHCKLRVLLERCIERISKSNLDDISIRKEEFPEEIIKQIKNRRKRPIEEDGQTTSAAHKRIKSIHKALDSDDVELVKMLLSESDMTLNEAFALHYAVAYCDSKVVNEVLALDQADVNLRNSRGYTVLHVAAMRRDPTIILRLLEKGASTIDLTPEGRNAVTICRRLTTPKEYNVKGDKENEAHRYRHSLDILTIREDKQHLAAIKPDISDSLSDNDSYMMLLYLETRVAFARLVFPSEAAIAMKFADADKTSEFIGFSALRGYDSAFDSNEAAVLRHENYRARIASLTKTVETARRYFPNCFKVIDGLMEDDIPNLIYLTKGTSKEQMEKKNRYKLIKKEIKEAFVKDRSVENEHSLLCSSSSSSSFRSSNTR